VFGIVYWHWGDRPLPGNVHLGIRDPDAQHASYLNGGHQAPRDHPVSRPARHADRRPKLLGGQGQLLDLRLLV
jgi:hypothetical protein